MTKSERTSNQSPRANIWFPSGGGGQAVFKNGSRRREEADFGAKNNSALLPRRLRPLRRFLNSPSGAWNAVQIFNLRHGEALNCLAMRTPSLFRHSVCLILQLPLLRLIGLVCALSVSSLAAPAPSTDPADLTVWPNQASHANGDRWLVEHHDQ